MRRSTVSNWFSKLHRPVSLRTANPNADGTIRTEQVPAWEDLHLETSPLSDGRILDFRLSCRGSSTARCMVARKGIYLLEPTGPAWARELLEEAVREWCAMDAEMN